MFVLLVTLGCAHPPAPVTRTTQAQVEQARATTKSVLAAHLDDVGECVSKARDTGDLSTVNATVAVTPGEKYPPCGAHDNSAGCTFAECARAKGERWGLPQVESAPRLTVLLTLRGDKASPKPTNSNPGAKPLARSGDALIESNIGFLWPPKQLSGEPLDSNAAAWMLSAEGQLVVWCNLDEQGLLHDCRVEKELGRLTDANLERLKGWRFEPARWNDTRVQVKYRFVVNLKMNP